VTNQVLMHILNAAYYLPKVKLCLILCYVIILYKLVELALRGQFHDDEYVIGGIQNFIKLDNVWMIDEF